MVIEGKLTMGTFEDNLKMILSASNQEGLVVKVQNLEEIDVCGIQLLHAVKNQIKNSEVEISCTNDVALLFDRIGFSELFNITTF